MKHHITHSILLVVFSLMLASCGTFNGNIVFKNKSQKDIWVDRVEGFEHPVPGGILRKKQKSTAFSIMGRMKMPEKITLRWSFDYDKSDQVTELSLKKIKKPKQNEVLFIVFTKEEKWNVYSGKK